MLDLTTLKNAINSMGNALAVYEDTTFIGNNQKNIRDVIEAGVIQNFEFTYELSLKFIIRWISINVSPELASPRTKRDIFRIASRYELIRDPKIWFQFSDARNLTSHTYDQKKAEIVLAIAPILLMEASLLFSILEQLND